MSYERVNEVSEGADDDRDTSSEEERIYKIDANFKSDVGNLQKFGLNVGVS